jgi:hypothetical protein
MMGLGAPAPGVTTADRGAFVMALVDIPGSAGTCPGTVEIILRATRLGLFTAAEAGVLIDRIRPHTTPPPTLSIQDNNRAGAAGPAGSHPISPDRTLR